MTARNSLLDEQAKAMGLGFRTVVATVLHRYPVVTPDPEQWELDMWDVQEKVGAAKREAMMDEIGDTDAQIIGETDVPIEEILETLPFEPAPRITEADKVDDRRSVERKLPNSLYLLVKRNRPTHPWQFPQGRFIEEKDDTLRGAAERIIDRAVGDVDRWFISNAPMGHYTYEYPAQIQEQRKEFGAKVYFFRAQLIEGNIRLETRLYKDYAWLTRSEASLYIGEGDADQGELMEGMLPASEL
jgi:hypothetical protein